MNPSVHDRLNSVVRALSGVILPALPPEASLAREQTMLSIGHLQIVLAQLDATPDFEAEEVADFEAIARAIAEVAHGGPRTAKALVALKAVATNATPALSRERTHRLQVAIDDLLVALVEDGDPEPTRQVRRIVLDRGLARAQKDRQWFSAMGFDAEFTTA